MRKNNRSFWNILFSRCSVFCFSTTFLIFLKKKKVEYIWLSSFHIKLAQMPATTGLHDSGPQDWYRDIPIITKILVSTTLLLTLFSVFGIVSAYNLVYLWPQIYNNFQIWRLFTAVLYAGPFSFNFAMHLYMLYSFSLRYEANIINTGARGSAADYLWMLMICSAVLWIVGYIFAIGVLSEPLLFAIIYLWSRHEPNSMASIFGFQFKAVYTPWMYCAFRLLMGNPVAGILIGIATGNCDVCISPNACLICGSILFQDMCISFWWKCFLIPTELTLCALPSSALAWCRGSWGPRSRLCRLRTNRPGLLEATACFTGAVTIGGAEEPWEQTSGHLKRSLAWAVLWALCLAFKYIQSATAGFPVSCNECERKFRDS